VGKPQKLVGKILNYGVRVKIPYLALYYLPR